MRNDDAQSLAFGLLAAGRALVDGVSAGVRARGFGDVRPAHGFAFARLSAGGATITQLAEHLGLTRQAAAQLVDELTNKGYVERHPHPRDARARLIMLTEKGWVCTQAAEAAITENPPAVGSGTWPGTAARPPQRLAPDRTGRRAPAYLVTRPAQSVLPSAGRGRQPQDAWSPQTECVPVAAAGTFAEAARLPACSSEFVSRYVCSL